MDDDELRREFQRFDADANGRIDEQEFSALVRSLGVNLSENRIAVAFGAIDIDASGSIEFGEFCSWWSRR
jgi:Ca2+-binding EF-hand superfamily protein